MELEDKAKVVVSVWGTEFVQFLATLASLGLFERKGRIYPIFPNRLRQNSWQWLAWQGIEQILPPKQTRRPLPFLLSPSFFCVILAPGHHYDQRESRTRELQLCNNHVCKGFPYIIRGGED